MKKTMIFFGTAIMIICILLFIQVRQDKEKTDELVSTDAIISNNIEVKGYKDNETRYINEKHFHDFDKEVTVGKLIFQVKEAQLKNEFSDDMEYYTKRGRVEYCKGWLTDLGNSLIIYEEELRYLYLTYTIENSTNDTQVLYLSKMSCVNRREDNSVWQTGDLGDIRITDITTTNHIAEDFDTESDIIVIKPNAKLEIEMIVLISPASIYDLYMVIRDETETNNEYISLNQKLGETDGNIFVDDEKVSTASLRDLAQLKINHTMNYDYFLKQEQGTVCREQYFFETDDTVGKPNEQKLQECIGESYTYHIEEAVIVNNLDELAENYKYRGYLQQMTDVCINKYGYKKAEIRYLQLTVTLKQLGDMYPSFSLRIPTSLWLYNRAANNKLWRLGYPDDYEIVTSTNPEQQLGHVDTINIKPDEEIVISATYVILSDTLYDVYLWNFQGAVPEGEGSVYCKDFATDGGISLGLNYYENGGVK